MRIRVFTLPNEAGHRGLRTLRRMWRHALGVRSAYDGDGRVAELDT